MKDFKLGDIIIIPRDIRTCTPNGCEGELLKVDDTFCYISCPNDIFDKNSQHRLPHGLMESCFKQEESFVVGDIILIPQSIRDCDRGGNCEAEVKNISNVSMASFELECMHIDGSFTHFLDATEVSLCKKKKALPEEKGTKPFAVGDRVIVSNPTTNYYVKYKDKMGRIGSIDVYNHVDFEDGTPTDCFTDAEISLFEEEQEKVDTRVFEIGDRVVVEECALEFHKGRVGTIFGFSGKKFRVRRDYDMGCCTASKITLLKEESNFGKEVKIDSMQNIFKAGDKVIIHPDIASLPDESPTINSGMRKMGGEADVVRGISASGQIQLVNHSWNWLPKWLLPASSDTEKEMEKEQFKVGQVYELASTGNRGCGAVHGKFTVDEKVFIKITRISSDGEGMDYVTQRADGSVVGSCCGCISTRHLIPYSASRKAMVRIQLSESQKKNLSKDAQALVEAGYYTNDLTLNSRDHFTNFLLNKFEAEYAEDAREKLKADDADKAKAQVAAEAAVRVSKK